MGSETMPPTGVMASPPISDSTHPSESSNILKKHPCVMCQQRKVKCDRNYPCANCKKSSVECISPSSLPPKKRKRRFPEAELLARLRKYEHYLKAYGADIDAINREDSVTPLPLSLAPKVPPSAQPYHPEAKSLSVRRSLKNIERYVYQIVSSEI